MCYLIAATTRLLTRLPLGMQINILDSAAILVLSKLYPNLVVPAAAAVEFKDNVRVRSPHEGPMYDPFCAIAAPPIATFLDVIVVIAEDLKQVRNEIQDILKPKHCISKLGVLRNKAEESV